MNKIFAKLFIVLTMLFAFGAQTNALVVNDIKADNSRAPQIKAMLEAGLMTVDANGNFNPKGSIARQDFLSVFLNTCKLQVSDAELMNMFKDVVADTGKISTIPSEGDLLNEYITINREGVILVRYLNIRNESDQLESVQKSYLLNPIERETGNWWIRTKSSSNGAYLYWLWSPLG